MATRKPAIPGDIGNPGFAPAVKEMLEIVTGVRPGLRKIDPLPTTATTADLINKINELLDRLQ